MVLVGRTKIPYQDLFILTNSEIESLVYGHEIDLKDYWELKRVTTGLMVSPWAEKGFDIKKYLPFGWDEKEETEFANKQDFEWAKKVLDKVEKAKNGK